MPLTVRLDAKRSPYYRVRGTVCGVAVDESSRLTDKRKAERYADRRTAEIERRHAAGNPAPQKPVATFAAAVKHYLTDPAKPANDTRFLIKLGDYFGDTPLSDITQASVDAFVRLYHAGNAPATVLRQVITPLRAVLRHAGEHPRFRQPVIKPNRLRYLTETEADRLLEAAAPHLRPLLVFCLHTGARMGEALALEWSEVDLVRGMVRFIETKNGESRGVPLNPRATEALANMSYPTAVKGQRSWSREGRVFRTQTGAPYPLHDNAGGQIKTAWKAACRRAQIDGATPHTMRHTFASWMVMNGTDLRTVGELLGHKSPAMTQRYSHLSPAHLKRAVDSLVGQDPGGSEIQRRKSK